MGEFDGRRIHFKHVYGTEVNAWGVVGLPSTQPARAASRRFRFGDPVLLAIPKDPEPVHGETVPERFHGKIFAVCTLGHIAISDTATIANPDRVRRFPEVVARWATALPIVSYWTFDHLRDYATFGHGELPQIASIRRGQLIQVPAAIEPEARSWLDVAPRTAKTLEYSEIVTRYLERFHQVERPHR